jgi:hypothetical protein
MTRRDSILFFAAATMGILAVAGGIALVSARVSSLIATSPDFQLPPAMPAPPPGKFPSPPGLPTPKPLPSGLLPSGSLPSGNMPSGGSGKLYLDS